MTGTEVLLILSLLGNVLSGQSILPERYRPLGCGAAQVAWSLACGADHVERFCSEQSQAERGLAAAACPGYIEVVDRGGEKRRLFLDTFTFRAKDRGRRTRIIRSDGPDFTVPYPPDRIEEAIQTARSGC